MGELEGYRATYSVQDLFDVIENKKLKADEQFKNNQHIKYRTSIIDLCAFLRKMQKGLVSLTEEYKLAVDQGWPLAEMVFYFEFRKEPRDDPAAFKFGFREIHMALNTIEGQLEDISPLEREVIYGANGAAVNPALQNSSRQASLSTHPSGPYSHPTQ